MIKIIYKIIHVGAGPVSAQKNKTHYKSYMGVLYISKNNFVSKYRGRTPGQPTKIRKKSIKKFFYGEV